MEYKDYYKILDVDKKATPEQIKKQYRVLARKYHPDVSKETNAEENFKEIREAYDVLKDPEKRKAYDELGSGTHTGAGFKPPPGWNFHQENYSDGASFETGGFSEFFENLFGQRARGGRRAQYSQRGEDIHSKITISLEEAFSGTERMITFQEPEQDSTTGRVTMKTRSLKVKIPTGVVAGQQIRLAQQGNKGIGGASNGDLFLEIQIADHSRYTVKHRDIYLNLPVTPWEAALGAKIQAPTLAGSVELTIPPNSQTGKKLRLKGRGLPGKIPGDQYISLTIYTPEAKTDSEKKLYEQMAKEMPYDPRRNIS